MRQDRQHHHPELPPSAAGRLEPYGARLTLRAGPPGLELESFLVALLEGVAAGCEASGARVIGHLKGLLHLPGGCLACNLTSLRTGATCTTQGAGTAVMLRPGEEAQLDLAVLVYDLSEDTIAALVRGVLGRLADGALASWDIKTTGGAA